MSHQQRHPNEDPALEQIAHSMDDFARQNEGDRLTETSKAKHRADLLALAASAFSSSSASLGAPQPLRHRIFSSKRVFALASALAVVVLVLNLALLVPPQRRNPAITSLLVPAAQSAEAFHLEPVKQLPGGIDAQAGWMLKTSVPASREALEQAIRLDPLVPVRVEKADNDAWRVIPEDALAANTVYKITLATVIEESNQQIPYEYSWAHQTVGDFRAEAFTPGPGAIGVPANSAIEITFSHDGFLDPSGFVTLSPQVEGRFETRGRVLVFLPTKPLTRGKVYTVTVKQGFGIANNPEMQIQKDLVYGFQTELPNDQSNDHSSDRFELFLPASIEVRTTMPIRIPLPDRTDGDYTLDAKMYRLSADEAKRYMALRQHPLGAFLWSSIQREEVAAMMEAKTPILTVERARRVIEPRTPYYRTSAVELPGQSAGFYLVALANSADPAQKANPEWTLIQVSDLAFHVVADRDRILAWVVNASLKQPVSGATVQVGGERVTTGADGTASLPIPNEFSTNGPTLGKVLTVDVTQDGQETFALLTRNRFGIWYGPPTSDSYAGNRDTWTYLYIDRRVQRRDDTIHVFGLALDRGTKRVPSGLKLRLVSSGYYLDGEFGFRANGVVIEEQPVQPDAAGRFQAAFSWKDRRAGTYEIQLVRDASIVSTANFDVRTEAKPMNTIDVAFDRQYAIAGETISGKAQVAYADGTRLPNAEVEIVVTETTSGERIYEKTLKTNDRGEVAFRAPTRGAAACSFARGWASGLCGNTDALRVMARLANASEGEVTKEATMTLLSSSQLLVAHDESRTTISDANGPYYFYMAPMARQEGPKLSMRGKILDTVIRGNAIDLTPKIGATVTAEVYKQVQERIQVGTTYNEITKSVEPVYSFQIHFDRVHTRNIVTDNQGVFADAVFVESQAQHQVIFTKTDEQGRRTSVNVYPIQEGAFLSAEEGSEPSPQIDLVYKTSAMSATDSPMGGGIGSLRLNESADAQVVMKGIQKERATKPLFILSTRSLQRSSYGDEYFKVVMDEASVPMISLYAIVYTESHGFMMANMRLNVEQERYKLAVDVRSDKNEYAPAESAEFTTRVLGADGKPVPNAKVALSIADKSLESLGAFGGTDVIRDLYGMYFDGVEAFASTHKATEQFGGGAEGGGGGPGDILMNVRRDFKDQAAFMVGETDANGEALFKVKMPDNLTTWRIEAVVLSNDLRGGETAVTRAVRKPLAIDAIIPKVLAPGDKAEFRLQLMTDDIANDAEVEYAIDAPTLGLPAQVIRAKGRSAVYVPVTITEGMWGEHVVRVGVRSGGRQDAMEVRVRVVDPGYTKTIWESAESIEAGFALPENRADNGTVLFTSRARGALLSEAQSLLTYLGFGVRAEGMVAARMARTMILEMGSKPSDLADPTWAEYQDLGIKPLPHSAPDVDTTLAVLYSQQAVGDRSAMGVFLTDIYNSKEATREQRIKAAVGLALIGRPMVDSLRAAAQTPNLPWNEEAVLLRGFIAIGARDEAKAILARWMQRLETRDGQAWINVSDAPSDVAEATRIATYAAYALADTHREALQSYLTHNSTSLRYNPVLDAQILALRVKQAPNEEAVLVYRVGDRTKEVRLNERSILLALNPDEWGQFSVVSTRGPVMVQWQRRVPGVPENTANMSITRTYQPIGGPDIKEGGLVRVILSPKLSPRDTHGCYEVRDRLPANLVPVVSWQYQEAWYPVQQDDGSVSFTACGSYNNTIIYTARVMVAGMYSAPMPVIQHLEQPSLSAVGSTAVFAAGKK